jgi:hypothetical protein
MDCVVAMLALEMYRGEPCHTCGMRPAASV